MYAAMAQLVERVLGKDEVTGSNPVSSSIKPLIFKGFFIVKKPLGTRFMCQRSHFDVKNQEIPSLKIYKRKNALKDGAT